MTLAPNRHGVRTASLLGYGIARQTRKFGKCIFGDLDASILIDRCRIDDVVVGPYERRFHVVNDRLLFSLPGGGRARRLSLAQGWCDAGVMSGMPTPLTVGSERQAGEVVLVLHASRDLAAADPFSAP
jgi:hypothetical protein